MSLPPRTYYERHLPHWQPPGKKLFVTWRLAGSLPGRFRRSCKQLTDGRRFVEFDRALDEGKCGSLWLRDPRVAELIVRAFHHGEQARDFYRLLAYVVMPNHVHLLLKANVPLQKITQVLKVTRPSSLTRSSASGARHFGKTNPSTIGFEIRPSQKKSDITSRTTR
jgi:hypothetical protein